MKPTLTCFGESAILCSWEQQISVEINDAVRAFERSVIQFFSEEILETVATYQSLAIYLKFGVDSAEFLSRLEKFELNEAQLESIEKRVFEVPVCYEVEFGCDLHELAEANGLTPHEVVEMHTSQTYPIYFLGFLPGFLYLGNLDARLHTPRKAVPRLTVPAGAVAIGGEQTGIYPQESPGGWNIIGRTPIQLFNPKKVPPTAFLPGNFIRFVEIDLLEFREIEALVKNDQYELKSSKA